MDMKLEVVPIPVTDVDRAKAFYADQVGFNVDHDVKHGEMRVLQMTPPGSACSIVMGVGIVHTAPGSIQGLHLVVDDIQAARAHLLERGVAASEVDDMGGILYVHFNDPDGNTWLLQEITARAARQEGTTDA